MVFFSRCLQVVKIVWASPGSIIGLTCGLCGICSGGRVALHTGVLEFHGGIVTWMLKQAPIAPAAITFGHVVLGQTQSSLDVTRAHERIHVCQYERWGPFFIPAYLICSAYQWMRGRRAYRDNPFEVEAYENS